MQRAGLCSTTICENTRIPCNHLNDRNAAFTAALLERRVFRREAYWLLLDLHGSAATSSQASAVTGPNAAMRTKHQHRKRHGKTATRDLPPGRSAALLGCEEVTHRPARCQIGRLGIREHRRGRTQQDDLTSRNGVIFWIHVLPFRFIKWGVPPSRHVK